MCHCNPMLGIVCDAHCKHLGCRDGHHADRCVGPGRRPLLESLARQSVDVTPALVAAFDAIEAAANGALR